MKKVVVIIVLLTLLLAVLYFVKHNFSSPNSSQAPTTQTSNFSPDNTKEIIIEDLTPPTNSQSEPIVNIYVKAKDSDKILIWHQNVGRASGIYFPKDTNIWSPDEEYAFVLMSGPDSINPLIIRTDGKTFSNRTSFLQLGVLFNKQTGYFIGNPIGWNSHGQFLFSATNNYLKVVGTYVFDPQTENFRRQ